jgi:hypothetical protein
MERKNPILQKGKGKPGSAASQRTSEVKAGGTGLKTTSRVNAGATGAKGTSRAKSATSRKRKNSNKGLSPPLKVVIVCVALVLLSPFYYGYVIKGFSSTWRWITDIGEDPNYRTYSSYNIKIPKGHSVHGIDVSSYQGKINWKMVKAMRDDDVGIGEKLLKLGSFAGRIITFYRKSLASGRLSSFFRP